MKYRVKEEEVDKDAEEAETNHRKKRKIKGNCIFFIGINQLISVSFFH